jgi:hypothetical protein
MQSTTCPLTAFATDESAAGDDRRWFERHPRRTHRIRPPGIGERQAMRDLTQPDEPRVRPFVVVRQVVPGVRLRQPAWLGARVPNLEPIAHAVFDLLLAAVRGGRDFVPAAEIKQRVAMLSEGGRA